MESLKPIPEAYQPLVRTIAAHAENTGEYRDALAEIQVRKIMVLEETGQIHKLTGEAIKSATLGLRNATWVLATATFVLVVITAIKH